jgi:hypothetical protein
MTPVGSVTFATTRKGREGSAVKTGMKCRIGGWSSAVTITETGWASPSGGHVALRCLSSVASRLILERPPDSGRRNHGAILEGRHTLHFHRGEPLLSSF